MATQGATLGRGTLHLPIWPLAAIVAGAAALMIGLTLIDAPRPVSTTSEQLPAVGISHVAPKVTTEVVGLENPGAYVGTAVGISHVTPNATTETFVGLENPGAYVAPSTTYVTGLENPGAYVAPSTSFATGLENPGAYVDEARIFANGLENPGAYVSSGSGDGVFEGTMGLRPGMTGDEICGQCR